MWKEQGGCLRDLYVEIVSFFRGGWVRFTFFLNCFWVVFAVRAYSELGAILVVVGNMLSVYWLTDIFADSIA